MAKVKGNEGAIRRVVLSNLQRKGGIIFGSRASNAQLPRFLEKKPKDFDIFVNRPKRRAIEVETKLDKLFRADLFKVKRGQSKEVRTFKVKTIRGDDTVVDFTNPNRFIPSVAIQGRRFATLADEKRRAVRNLTKPSARFRRQKDLDLLKRIAEFERRTERKI